MTVLEATTQVLANQAAQQAQLDSITQTLQLILSAVAGPATPAGVVITLTEGALKNMAKKAAGCGLDTSQGLGVPFFFDGKNCLVGDQNIIDFFQK